MTHFTVKNNRVYLEWISLSKKEGLPEWYYRVALYDNNHGNVYEKSSNKTVEMITWCENNCNDIWGTYEFGVPSRGRVFFFIDGNDCLLFKMVWA